MLSLFAANFGLATKASRLLFNAAKPVVSGYHRVGLTASGVTRSFVTTPRVAFPAAAKKAAPKKTTKAAAPRKKAAKKKTAAKPKVKAKPKRKAAPKPKPKPKIVLKREMLPPSSPGGPYLQFAKEYHAKYPIKSLPEAAEAMKKCGAAWNALDKSEKEKYYEQYRKAFEEYAVKRAEYFATVDPEIIKEINRRKKAKGKSKIRPPPPPVEQRRPMTSYLQFYHDYRKEHSQGASDLKILAAEAGKAWRELPEAKKQVYKDQYMARLETWRAQYGKSAAASA
ncbi:hypothetical protein AMATHDRAFT_67547 [Amanita thiersii Skay4041]|uniref:HMG box domain-containing protein n=1 Tax=Amanita thiersii Skay4041 TaxID=703135 RepID=A0A2A9NH37_9AGAR|nr:hypothetical protein AMATHDRAFT_67547 [Amanita thiersii Skay4041]